MGKTLTGLPPRPRASLRRRPYLLAPGADLADALEAKWKHIFAALLKKSYPKTGVQQPGITQDAEWRGVLQIAAYKGLACVLPTLCALCGGSDSSLSGCET